MSVEQRLDALELDVDVLQSEVSALQNDLLRLAADVDLFWLLIFGVIIFLMQAGFCLLEAGSVRSKCAINIAFKNTMDVCVGAIAWYLVGFAFAFGNTGKFIGYKYFALTDVGCLDEDCTSFALWFFQFGFAATAVTIASGAMAERTQLVAYLIYSFLMCGFIYPVVVHWQWSDNGWYSPFSDDDCCKISTNGFIDFAGGAAVHIVGGFAGLIGALVLGPRMGRFDSNGPKPQGHNIVYVAIGVIILWFGWYGFNPGSALRASSGGARVAGRAAVNTTLSAAISGLVVLIVNFAVDRQLHLSVVLNGVLAGLVSITAGCGVIEGWAAVIIGFFAGLFVFGTSRLLILLRVDDPIDVFPVHGVCGLWGVVAVGAFASREGVCQAYYGGETADDCDGMGLDYGFIMGSRGGKQLGIQIIGALVVIGWTCALSGILFVILRLCKLLRVPAREERMGLDEAKHGGHAYPEHSLIMRTLATKVMTTAEEDNDGADDDVLANDDKD